MVGSRLPLLTTAATTITTEEHTTMNDDPGLPIDADLPGEPTPDELLEAARALVAQADARADFKAPDLPAEKGTALAEAIAQAEAGERITAGAPAVEAEAAGVEVQEVEWRGLTLHVPLDVEDWPIDAVEAFEDGKQLAFARALLPLDEYLAMKQVTPRVRDFKAFMDLMAERLGFADAGNS